MRPPRVRLRPQEQVRQCVRAWLTPIRNPCFQRKRSAIPATPSLGSFPSLSACRGAPRPLHPAIWPRILART